MPLVFPASGFGRTYEQTAKAGVTVTASATAHTMGAWATLIDPLSYDLFGLALTMAAVAAAATDTRMLVDIGIAPTGGGSEQVVLPYLDAGAASAINVGGKSYFFPLYVPSGKAVRARCQALIVSDTVLIGAHAFELPPHGFAEDAPQGWAQYGADAAASRGTAVTSGNGAFGTEVQITASTGRAHRWFHVGIDFGTNTTITAGVYRVRLARDAAAADVIGIWDFAVPSTNEDIGGPTPQFPVCYPIPAGEPLYVDIDGGAAEAMSALVYAY
ncbi:MAG: hypothetical protein ACRDHY_05215 [Anaerolineales bacterium]